MDVAYVLYKESRGFVSGLIDDTWIVAFSRSLSNAKMFKKSVAEAWIDIYDIQDCEIREVRVV